MVSDFIEERDSYLALRDEHYKMIAQTEPNQSQSARQLFEYGMDIGTMNCFWTKLVLQYEWLKQNILFESLNMSGCLTPDALVASRLNQKPGGKQPIMRDTVWAGIPQKLVLEHG